MADLTSKEGDVLKIDGDIYTRHQKGSRSIEPGESSLLTYYYQISDENEETIRSQKHQIDELENTCGELMRDLDTWQGAVTQKDVALSDALNQLAVSCCEILHTILPGCQSLECLLISG